MRPHLRAERGKTLLAMAMAIWITSLITAAPAAAHDKLIGSNPADGSAVKAMPQTVTLYFEEPPGTGFSSLKVLSPVGKDIASAQPTIVGSQMSVPVVSTTQSGAFTIQFSIISDDGHPVAGVRHFSVEGVRSSSAGSAADTQPRTSPPARSVSLRWAAIGAVAMATLVLARLATKRLRAQAG